MKEGKKFGSSVKVFYDEMNGCFDVYICGVYFESFEYYHDAKFFIKRVAKSFRNILNDERD